MRTKSVMALAVLALVAWSVSRNRGLEAAQEPDLLRSGTRIALVNMTRVFELHNVFKQRVAQMRGDVEEAEKKLKSAKDKLEQAKNALESLPQGSDARSQAQKQFELDSRALEIDVNAQKTQFMRQEAQIYMEVYESVLAIISDYADQHKIGLVMRFNDSPADRGDLQSAMRQLNNLVLYHQGIDITAEIVRRANAG